MVKDSNSLFSVLTFLHAALHTYACKNGPISRTSSSGIASGTETGQETLIGSAVIVRATNLRSGKSQD